MQLRSHAPAASRGTAAVQRLRVDGAHRLVLRRGAARDHTEGPCTRDAGAAMVPAGAAPLRRQVLLAAAAALAFAPRNALAAVAAQIGKARGRTGAKLCCFTCLHMPSKRSSSTVQPPLPSTCKKCPYRRPRRPPLPPPAPVTVRPELAPDQASYDPADPELRAAAQLLQEALNASSVVREEELWTAVIDK